MEVCADRAATFMVTQRVAESTQQRQESDRLTPKVKTMQAVRRYQLVREQRKAGMRGSSVRIELPPAVRSARDSKSEIIRAAGRNQR